MQWQYAWPSFPVASMPARQSGRAEYGLHARVLANVATRGMQV
ncbi:hypothetical protein [Novacetimonas maltaceti]|uniref:Uncharacterized protein n=1 Tax=Novacetimonas maltaceti TaxID=1203393 RepID=A0A2S3W1M6_9PROT|nr:hypothetical protein [Novacetimonas maltaceti]POF62708.1 hypothetical protein KMAL_16450 [Novacetimonas maltaceti]